MKLNFYSMLKESKTIHVGNEISTVWTPHPQDIDEVMLVDLLFVQ